MTAARANAKGDEVSLSLRHATCLGTLRLSVAKLYAFIRRLPDHWGEPPER